MTTQETLDRLLQTMSEGRLRRVLEFAQFLAAREEREDWDRLAQEQFAQAYGPDEPEYSEADLKPELNP